MIVGRASVLWVVLAGCSSPRVFECLDDAQCSLEGVAGQCEATGYCSRPDGACASGFRYVDQAPGAVAGQCVGDEGGDGGGGGCLGPGCCDGAPCPATGCVTEIAAGARHSCVITQAGAAYCWGDNATSQLGSVGGDSPTPREVGSVLELRAVVAGADHSCALTAAGDVQCWGDNDAGQLGLGVTGIASLPGITVGSLAAVAELSAAGGHTCARTSEGAVACWGDNGSGEVLAGEPGAVPGPVEITDLLDTAAAVAAGAVGNAMVIDGNAVVTWGQAGIAALGRGAGASSAPDLIAGFTARAVAAGGAHACAIEGDGALACWGKGDEGQLGGGATSASPVEVAGLVGVDEVSAGDAHTCARSGHQLVCFGDGASGQLGTVGATGGTPVAVAGAWLAVAAGGQHSCGLAASREVYCWGAGGDGQLGDGGGDHAEPARVDVPCP